MVQVRNRKIKTNTAKEIALCTRHRKLIKLGVNIKARYRNVT